jgi:hypothetical protein
VSTATTIPQTLQLYFIPFLLTVCFTTVLAAGFTATFFADGFASVGFVFVADAVLAAIYSPLLYFFFAATVFATGLVAGFTATFFAAGFAATFLVATGFAATFFAAGFATGFFATGFVPIYSPLLYILQNTCYFILILYKYTLLSRKDFRKSIIFFGIFEINDTLYGQHAKNF